MISQPFRIEDIEEPSENPDLGKSDGRGEGVEAVIFRLYITTLAAPGTAETMDFTLDGDNVANVVGEFHAGSPSILFTTVEGDIVGIPRSNVFDFYIETITATNVIPFRRK